MQLRGALLLAVSMAAWLTDARADGGAIDARASSELAAYSDTDHVAVVTPSVSGHVGNASAGWSVDGWYLVDVISAASVDIVSTASGRWTEVRQAGGARGAYKPHDLGLSVEGSVSSEPDYLAYAAGGYVTEDLDDRNLSIILGYGYGHDTIGRTGTPFSIFSHSFDHHAMNVGLTRLIDRTTVLAVAADVTIESGDSSKPYRYIPLFSPEVAPSVQAGASVQEVSRLRLPETVIERLPLSRDRYGITARLARRLPGATARIESSLYEDSWGIKAFSADGRDLFDVGPRLSLGPHVRYYVQSPVTFWKVGYAATADAVPAFRTGDRELGPLINLTGGARATWNIGPAAAPDNWSLVASFDATYARFLDDLYITERLSALGSLTIEASW
jgi:hypothetical protein